MKDANSPCRTEVEELLLNANLRDQLEPYLDESVDFLQWNNLPTEVENEFLASMLAWERAPVLPIGKWFEPEMQLPAAESLSNTELSRELWNAIEQLYEQRIVLELTDHLSDRELYCVIIRDILPSYEKKIDLARNYLHWHCLDTAEDETTWLRYYASKEERLEWAEATGQEPPEMQSPPYPRKMPRRPR